MKKKHKRRGGSGEADSDRRRPSLPQVLARGRHEAQGQPDSTPPSEGPGMHKRRGGQPNNHNAYKHGFYSALFKDKERKLLEDLPAADLSAEIELIRVTNTRFLEALQVSKGTLDYEANLTALRAVNMSAQSIAMLLRVQTLTGSVGQDAAEALAKIDALITDEPQKASELGADAWGLVPSEASP